MSYSWLLSIWEWRVFLASLVFYISFLFMLSYSVGMWLYDVNDHFFIFSAWGTKYLGIYTLGINFHNLRDSSSHSFSMLKLLFLFLPVLNIVKSMLPNMRLISQTFCYLLWLESCVLASIQSTWCPKYWWFHMVYIGFTHGSSGILSQLWVQICCFLGYMGTKHAVILIVY